MPRIRAVPREMLDLMFTDQKNIPRIGESNFSQDIRFGQDYSHEKSVHEGCPSFVENELFREIIASWTNFW